MIAILAPLKATRVRVSFTAARDARADFLSKPTDDDLAQR